MSSIDYNSVKTVVNNSNQAFVYGTWSFGNKLKDLLKKNDSPIDFVITWKIGKNMLYHDQYGDFGFYDRVVKKGCDFVAVHQFPYSYGMDQCPQASRTAIINLIFENFKRFKTGETLIPMMFIVNQDKSTWDSPEFTPEIITSREYKYFTTHTQRAVLRRCYKVICTFENDSEFSEIAIVAKATMKFVHLKDLGSHSYALESVSPFWEAPTFPKLWEERKACKEKYEWKSKKEFMWRDQLKLEISKFLSQNKKN